jgi:hypothetical protein
LIASAAFGELLIHVCVDIVLNAANVSVDPGEIHVPKTTAIVFTFIGSRAIGWECAVDFLIRMEARADFAQLAGTFAGRGPLRGLPIQQAKAETS